MAFDKHRCCPVEPRLVPVLRQLSLRRPAATRVPIRSFRTTPCSSSPPHPLSTPEATATGKALIDALEEALATSNLQAVRTASLAAKKWPKHRRHDPSPRVLSEPSSFPILSATSSATRTAVASSQGVHHSVNQDEMVQGQLSESYKEYFKRLFNFKKDRDR